jgi:hypothetical protein
LQLLLNDVLRIATDDRADSRSTGADALAATGIDGTDCARRFQGPLGTHEYRCEGSWLWIGPRTPAIAYPD